MLHEIVWLINSNPLGSFLIISAMVAGVVSVAKAYINRNRPVVECNCDCCEEEDDCCEDDEED